ncbi:MAG: hypothetical protein JO269_05520 [Burkholderiaceae bacterium]|nr:hypothetical protein [Burkholderiaceae bacterium]
MLMAACAVEQVPVKLASRMGDVPAQPVHLVKQINLQLDTGYTRTLKSDSMWLNAGSVEQGEVYRPYKDVFTVEGAHIHEAYLVVSDHKLVGFYLPAEQAFSPLRPGVPIAFQQ